MYLQYTVDAEADEPIMLLNKHIGMDDEDGMGIQGDLFQQELLYLDSLNKKRIQIWINSIGGVVVDTYNIITAMQRTKTPVDTYCMGIAASSAGVLFQAGRKRIMADYGILMYHNPSGGTDDSLEAIRSSLITLVSTKSGMSAEDVGKMFNRTSFIESTEAKHLGLCDEVESSLDFNKKHWKQLVSEGQEGQAIWKEGNQILNKVLDTQNQISMKKVANKLGLVEDAKEESIVEAINKIEDRAVKAEAEVISAKADVVAVNKSKAAIEEEMKKHKDAYDACKSELDKMKSDMSEAEDKVKIEKATNLVAEAVKIGRLKNEADTIAIWNTKAKEDFEGTKKIIDALPLSKEAPKKDKVVNEGSKSHNVASQMMKIAAKHKQL